MNAALVLIDLQNDFLAAPGLLPAAGAVTARAAQLLAACRAAKLPVIHVYTTVTRSPDNRMPHWRAANLWQCELGTAGHAPPSALTPKDGEVVVQKQFFSSFGGTTLDSQLPSLNVDTLILAGVHTHGCVRATAFDAYQRGFRLLIAEDALASDDHLHAAATRRYLGPRMAKFVSVAAIEALLRGEEFVPAPKPTDVAATVAAARIGFDQLQSTTVAARIAQLRQLQTYLHRDADRLAALITAEVKKPITQAKAEVRRSIDLIEGMICHAPPTFEVATSEHARFRYVPLGVVAVIAPWNNPLAIPVGKIAPALLYGNSVVFKPAPAAAGVAAALATIFREAGWGEAVHVLNGTSDAAAALCEHPQIDAITVSGSLHAGDTLLDIALRRRVPFQGELGGNNAAIICDDTDLEHAAKAVAFGAFVYAGQRCTANRRAIVMRSVLAEFVEKLKTAMAALPVGSPDDPQTVVGPVISVHKADELRRLIDRLRSEGLGVFQHPQSYRDPCFVPPIIVICEDPQHEVVQEESFGPLLVVQPVDSFEEAIDRCNGVRQGLIAALFTESAAMQREFLRRISVGVVKINQSTADADAYSPLGGTKASGFGPPEHGPCDREFFTRTQTIYS